MPSRPTRASRASARSSTASARTSRARGRQTRSTARAQASNRASNRARTQAERQAGRWLASLPPLSWLVLLVIVAATAVAWYVGGIGAALIVVGAAALVTGLYALLTGRASWARIAGRASAAVVVVVSLVVGGVGISQLGAGDPNAPGTPGGPALADGSTNNGGDASAGTVRALLETLPVKGRAVKTGYDRTGDFGDAWLDVDENGCDTRNDILARDLEAPTYEGSCKVLSGILDDPYTGTVINFTRGVKTSTAVQIDHVVALLNAWETGAQQISQQQRIELANDPLNLMAVDGPTNSSKGAGDAATWLPPATDFRCAYVARQVAVKAKYDLWVTRAEHDAIARVLSRCPDEPVPTAAEVAVP